MYKEAEAQTYLIPAFYRCGASADRDEVTVMIVREFRRGQRRDGEWRR